MVGPVWTDPIHNLDFVNHCISHLKSNKDLFGTFSRIECIFFLILSYLAILTCISEELLDYPFYFSLSDCFSFIKSETAPLMEIISDLISQGKLVSKSHAKPNCIKTNATPFGTLYFTFSNSD